MPNKKNILISSAVIIVLVFSISGFVVYKKQTSAKKLAVEVQGSASIAKLNQGETKSISLGDNKSNSNTDSNALRVENSPSTSNPANLGSGILKNSSSTSGNNASSNTPSTPSVPGPESFGQYEQYKDAKSALFGDLQVGTGAEVAVNKKVTVYYKGYLTNGKMFDQAVDKTLTFTVGAHQVISGWEQDIIGMKVGGIRRMIIPPVVGYGDQPQGPIPANSVLVFDVQLVSVE